MNKNLISKLISENKIDLAVNTLLEVKLPDDLHDQLVMIKSHLSLLREQEQKGTLDFSEALRQRAIIISNILNFIKTIDSGEYTRSKYCLEFDDPIKQILDPRQDIVQPKQVELKYPLKIYASNYCVYWKSRYGDNPIESDGILTLKKNGTCSLKSGEESFEGFAMLKLPNLFITLSNENETIYLIIRVGISKKIPNYLPGVFSAVGGIDSTMPYSAIVVLIKQDFKEKLRQKDFLKNEKNKLGLFFEYLDNSHHSIEIDNNMMVILNSK
jgi:Effector-associated domain 11